MQTDGENIIKHLKSNKNGTAVHIWWLLKVKTENIIWKNTDYINADTIKKGLKKVCQNLLLAEMWQLFFGWKFPKKKDK